MLVVLQKGFFINKELFQPNGSNPIEMPDALFDKLPSTAKVVEPPKNVKEAEADVTDEEKKTKQAEINAKIKATKAANKAKKEAFAKDFTKQ